MKKISFASKFCQFQSKLEHNEKIYTFQALSTYPFLIHYRDGYLIHAISSVSYFVHVPESSPYAAEYINILIDAFDGGMNVGFEHVSLIALALRSQILSSALETILIIDPKSQHFFPLASIALDEKPHSMKFIRIVGQQNMILLLVSLQSQLRLYMFHINFTTASFLLSDAHLIFILGNNFESIVAFDVAHQKTIRNENNGE